MRYGADTSKCNNKWPFLNTKSSFFPGQFSIISAFSIENSETFWNFCCNSQIHEGPAAQSAPQEGLGKRWLRPHTIHLKRLDQVYIGPVYIDQVYFALTRS